MEKDVTRDHRVALTVRCASCGAAAETACSFAGPHLDGGFHAIRFEHAASVRAVAMFTLLGLMEHYKLRAWADAGADIALLPQSGFGQTHSLLVAYVGRRAQGSKIDEALVRNIRVTADLRIRAAFEELHASVTQGATVAQEPS